MSQRGFTLIECIVAASLIVLGFLAVASVFPASMRGATTDQNHTIAVNLAQNVLEGLRNHPYGTTTGLDPTTFVPTSLSSPFALSGETEGIATVTARTADDSNTPGFSVKVAFLNNSAVGPITPADQNFDIATVTVSWTEGTAIEGNGGGSAANHAETVKNFVLQGGISREP